MESWLTERVSAEQAEMSFTPRSNQLAETLDMRTSRLGMSLDSPICIHFPAAESFFGRWRRTSGQNSFIQLPGPSTIIGVYQLLKVEEKLWKRVLTTNCASARREFPDIVGAAALATTFD
jgi:hypothetical protein